MRAHEPSLSTSAAGWRPAVGERVVHRERGPGVVLDLLAGGRARVRFEAQPALPRRVPHRELRPAPVGSTASATPAEARLPRRTAEQLEALAILASLRLGLVPDRGATRYAVGSERLQRTLRQWLGEAPGLRLVEGPYGGGKTHTLHVMKEGALQQGWAVAQLTFDPGRSRRPVLMWQDVLDSLQLPMPDGPGDVGPLDPFVALARRLRERAPEALTRRTDRDYSPLLSPYGWALGGRELSAADRLLLRAELRAEGGASIEQCRRVFHRVGWRGERPPRLVKAWRTLGHVFTHLLSTLACWCERAGFAGLVVFLDEVERRDAVAWHDREWVANTFKWLSEVTEGRGARSATRGGHRRLKELPPRLRRDHRLLVVAADVTRAAADEAYAHANDRLRALLPGAERLEGLTVPRMTGGNPARLADRLVDVYLQAHPDLSLAPRRRERLLAAAREAAEELATSSDEPLARHLVREVLERLDEALHDQEASR